MDDVEREHDRLTKLGVRFTMPATKTTGSGIVMLEGTCGNLIPLTKLAWG